MGADAAEEASNRTIAKDHALISFTGALPGNR